MLPGGGFNSKPRSVELAFGMANLATSLERQRDEARELARELRDALLSACRFVDCYESESAAAIDDKWATARKCNAALIKAKEVLP
jgi:hypothetical protein